MVTDRDEGGGIDMCRLCCNCVDELETLGAATMVLAAPTSSLAGVRIAGGREVSAAAGAPDRRLTLPHLEDTERGQGSP